VQKWVFVVRKIYCSFDFDGYFLINSFGKFLSESAQQYAVIIVTF
jgi:hypothetical protein